MDPGLRRDDTLRGKDGSVPHTPTLPDETVSSNQRLAKALSKRRGIGDLPRFTTDAINTEPKKAIPEIVDLLHQVRKSDPKQADALFTKTLQGITPEHGQAMQKAVQPSLVPDAEGNTDQPVPPDPGQDDPEEPTEPKNPGQDDPEDPCAVYLTAVADAEANVEALEAHADELERERVDLANQVNEKEQKKLQIQDILNGMTTVYEGAKYHPSTAKYFVNDAFGMTEEEFKSKNEKLRHDLIEKSKDVHELRDQMHRAREERQAIYRKIASARGQLAQAQANLRRCEQDK